MLLDLAVRWRHRRIPDNQTQNYETESKISFMITSLLSDMFNKTSKEKYFHMFWLQIFDPTLQYYRLESSIYGPLAVTFTLSC